MTQEPRHEVEELATEVGPLLVRTDRPGSHVLVSTLADPRSATPMAVLPIRLTVT